MELVKKILWHGVARELMMKLLDMQRVQGQCELLAWLNCPQGFLQSGSGSIAV